VLVHEDSHNATPPHNDDGGDDSPDGSFGVQMRWLDGWWDAQVDRSEMEPCWEIQAQPLAICDRRIVDVDGFTPCPYPYWRRYDCG
jgi:hypothetical protein